MRVAIDTNPVYTSQAGVARYVRGLQDGLARIAAPADFAFSECAWPVSNVGYGQPWRAMRTMYRELVWARFRAPRALLGSRADLYHTTGPLVITPPKPIKHVVTLHDVAVLRHPERFRPWLRRSAVRSFAKLSTADRILCVSRFTADEAIALLDLPSSKLEVVHNGCDFADAGPEAQPDAAVPAEFFLFVGSLEPGKNLALLRDTYLLAERSGGPLPPLVIAGARWKGVAHEGAAPRGWTYLGGVSDQALTYLYRRALALVFPSKYEGFGLPVVEAMRLGCPVVCSPVASLPEVAGSSALFASLDPSAYLDAMRRVAGTPQLRDELIAKGRAHAERFTWETCARATLDVYRRA